MKHIKKERWERQADFGHKLLKEEYIRKYLEKKIRIRKSNKNMLYTVKLHSLAPWEMRCLERTLGYFQRNGIKITYLKKVIYIHCDSNKPYQGLLNIMHSYTRSNRISYNEKTAKWLSKYYPFKQ